MKNKVTRRQAEKHQKRKEKEERLIYWICVMNDYLNNEIVEKSVKELSNNDIDNYLKIIIKAYKIADKLCGLKCKTNI